MLKQIFFVYLFSFGSFAFLAQKISGKVYSKNTLEPIEKLAIATNLNNGAISNIDGSFKLNLKNSSTITLSCLGYVTKTLSIKTLKKINFTVYLDETVNQLAEIRLHIIKTSLDSLLLKATKSMQENYIYRAI
jgi:spore coat protein U-like protein